MSNTPKIPAQEIIDNLASLVAGRKHARLMFDGYPFTRKFHLLEVEPGKYRYLEERADGVMVYTTDAAITKAVNAFCDKLPKEDEFKFYKIKPGTALQVLDYWSSLPEVLFTKRIYPVLEKSEPGYTFRRLDFDAQEGPCPLFDSFLRHVRTNAPALLAYLGGLHDADFRRQFYLWMWGTGGDGKGTLMRYEYRLFGSAYMTSGSAKASLENRFFGSTLIGKRILAFQDCHNPRLVTDETFMQITGGDPLRIEPKGEAPYMADIDAMVMVSSNFPPALSNSPAHIRRAIICEMDTRTALDGSPETFEERLWTERAAILWKCKEAWRKMKAEHGGMVVDSDCARDTADDTELHFVHLVDKYLEHKPGVRSAMRPQDLVGLLKEQEHMNDLEIGRFKQYLLRKDGVSIVKPPQGKSEARPSRIWIGMHLKESAKQLLPQPATAGASAPKF